MQVPQNLKHKDYKKIFPSAATMVPSQVGALFFPSIGVRDVRGIQSKFEEKETR